MRQTETPRIPRTLSRALPKAVAATVAAGLLATGCSLSADPGSDKTEAKAGSLAKAANLKGVKVTVGSKEFTEQLILCEITAQALQSAGAQVTRKCGLQGSDTTRKALTSANIDMYWEYTGTAWISYMQHTKPVPGSQGQYEAVKKEDEKENGIVWLDYASFNNSYAIGAKAGKAKELGVATLSDLAKLAKDKPAQASLCTNSEFAARDDGLPGVEKTYDFKLPSDSVATLQEGAIYNAVDKGDPCNFGMMTNTDGRVKALGLTILKDDKAFFPLYNPAVSIRKQVLDANPNIAKVLNPVAKALDTKGIRSLNSQVDIDGLRPPETATKWLQNKGFIG
ncbi:MAG: glycine/betaine ABC transporter substrate-binding protein [Streptosporangiales bacterium]|nr:glycine/betaine ABC transporter substrate-binding protein [Streptosporangiales bacterium]